MHSKAYECKMPKRLIIYGGRSTEQTRSLMKPRGTVLSICLDGLRYLNSCSFKDVDTSI